MARKGPTTQINYRLAFAGCCQNIAHFLNAQFGKRQLITVFHVVKVGNYIREVRDISTPFRQR